MTEERTKSEAHLSSIAFMLGIIIVLLIIIIIEMQEI